MLQNVAESIQGRPHTQAKCNSTFNIEMGGKGELSHIFCEGLSEFFEKKIQISFEPIMFWK